jgi:hypothetical protein
MDPLIREYLVVNRLLLLAKDHKRAGLRLDEFIVCIEGLLQTIKTTINNHDKTPRHHDSTAE